MMTDRTVVSGHQGITMRSSHIKGSSLTKRGKDTKGAIKIIKRGSHTNNLIQRSSLTKERNLSKMIRGAIKVSNPTKKGSHTKGNNLTKMISHTRARSLTRRGSHTKESNHMKGSLPTKGSNPTKGSLPTKGSNHTRARGKADSTIQTRDRTLRTSLRNTRRR